MGKVQLVLVSEDEGESNKVNTDAINKSILDSETFIAQRGLEEEI